MDQNEQSQENQQPIEEIKLGLRSYLKSPLAKWVIALSVVAFIIGYLFFRIQYLENSRLTKVQPTTDMDTTPSPTRILLPTDIIPSVTPKPTLPDFSKEPVKPRTNIDTSNWLTFDDPQVGLRYKYPPAWGVPSKSEDKGDKGSRYIVEFIIEKTGRTFLGGGVTLDYDERVGEPDVYIFSGFESGNWKQSKEEICNGVGTIFCQKEDNIVHVLTGFSCIKEQCNPFTYFSRYMYINRPNKKYPGLVIGGGFTSEFLDEIISKAELDPKYLNGLNKALIDRRLDNESMKNFDTIEKVFETVERSY